MTRNYDFHGVAITVECADPDVAAAIDARFSHFQSDESSVDVLFRFHFLDDGEAHAVQGPAGQGTPIYDPPTGSVLYYADEDVLLIDSGADRVRVVCRPADGHVDVSVKPEGRDLWLVSRPLVTLPLIETLKRRGLHSVHASAVAKQGRCVLLAGATGSGKTTLAVALGRAGFDLVADDMVFLRPEATVVLGFPDELDVADPTLEMFPELTLAGVREEGWSKFRVRPDAVGSIERRPTEPSLLIYPRLGADRRSVLEPIAADQALQKLVPNVLLTEPAASQEHLTALGALVERSRCYALQTGRDFGRLAAEVASRLEESVTN